MSAELYKIEGRDGGKNKVRTVSTGEVQLLTDDEWAELQGTKAVRKLSDERRIKELEATVAELDGSAKKAGSERDEALAKLHPAEEAAAEWQQRAEQAEATVAELEAKVKSLEGAAVEAADGGKPKKASQTKAG